MADLLEVQQASPFRVAAYRRAAITVEALNRDLSEIVEAEGEQALVALPEIGKGIAAALAELVRTGRWGQLERLRGLLDPVNLFQTVPGIGPELATRIHDTLHIDTLEGLEAAAYDGRLTGVPGLGPRRVAALQAALATLLRRTRPPAKGDNAFAPDVSLLLEVDQIYREASVSDRLPKIAPKRFNPDGHAWLPVLHMERSGWHFTAMYSNTARAHQLGRTADWVVLYYYDEHHREGQATVVTETHGPLTGHRVVRGRESECMATIERRPP